jgi:hypothetical protein
MFEALATACPLSLPFVDTNFTEPTEWNSMVKAPHVEKWLAAAKLEFDTLVKMGCWEVVDIPIGAPLLFFAYYFSSHAVHSHGFDKHARI